MADTDTLRRYKSGAPPQLGDDKRYLQQELQKISAAIGLLVNTMVLLEERIVALEPP